MSKKRIKLNRKSFWNVVNTQERIEDVFEYCKPHLDKMWAATVVSTLLQCDFRDAAQWMILLA